MGFTGPLGWFGKSGTENKYTLMPLSKWSEQAGKSALELAQGEYGAYLNSPLAQALKGFGNNLDLSALGQAASNPYNNPMFNQTWQGIDDSMTKEWQRNVAGMNSRNAAMGVGGTSGAMNQFGGALGNYLQNKGMMRSNVALGLANYGQGALSNFANLQGQIGNMANPYMNYFQQVRDMSAQSNLKSQTNNESLSSTLLKLTGAGANIGKMIFGAPA